MTTKDPAHARCPSAESCQPLLSPRVPGAPASPPAGWRRVGAVADVPPNGMRSFFVDGVAVMIVRLGEELAAVQSLCPHEGVPLDLGALDGDRLTCLEHMWQFDLRSGAPLGDEATEGLRTFPVRNEGGDLYVALG